MDRSVSFGITTVLLPGESASIVEEVMSIFLGNQAVSEQVIRTIATLPAGEAVLPLSVYEAATAASGTGVRTNIAVFSTTANHHSAITQIETATTSTMTTASTSLSTSSSQLSPTTTSATIPISSSTAAAGQDTHENSGVSAAAIAGTVISCLLIGVLVGFAAAWLFLFKRKRRWQPSQSASYHPVNHDIREKHLPVTPSSRPDLFHFDQFLTNTKSDPEIVHELRSLDRSIRRHVAVHYHMQPVQDQDVNPEDLARVLVKLGIHNGSRNDEGNDRGRQQKTHSASRLTALALDLSTRSQTLRHIIMRVALGSTALCSSSPVSMLPPFMASFAREIGKSKPLGQQRQLRANQDVFSTALAKWRQLSVYLIRPSRGSSTNPSTTPLVPSEDVSTQQAQQLAVELNRFLAPFVAADGDDDGLENLSRYEQENDLRESLVECATLGYLLLSQPSEYEFVFFSEEEDEKKGMLKWRSSRSRKGVGNSASQERKKSAVVVCPGLRRVRGKDGQGYSSPEILVGPAVEQDAIVTSTKQ
ncbi:uncharacterized protein PG998_006206 [Apiospora kogelbergensis]|uniref:uncharacterized protein n=1 Tax=Apiospora kogelbergensis TaxID=1337665 RepID=UPI003130340D